MLLEGECGRKLGGIKIVLPALLGLCCSVRYANAGVPDTAIEFASQSASRQLQVKPRRGQVESRGSIIPGCAIYILDLNSIATEEGIPRCNLGDIVVDARTQVPYLRDFSTANKAKKIIPTPHYFSGNSAPWFARRSVEKGPYWSRSLSNATVIMVDDYCFKLWWLSYIHSDKQDQLPGENLMRLYEHLLARPEWKETLGSKHVFFQSHTGFAHGPLGDMYEKFLCETLVNSMHIVNVRASRLRCRTVYNPDNFIIAPGSVHYHDIREFQDREKERLRNREGENFRHGRDFLLFFKGKCTPLNFTWKVEAVHNRIAESTVNVGKLMRVEIVKQIQGMGQDVRAACTGDVEEMKDVQNERPHWEQMDEFTRSTFCLLVSGDSQTSRRLPEAIMAGCIPVFPGPPYHTMPFGNLVDYSKFAIFFQFNSTPWTESITVHWEVEEGKRPHHPTDSEWWVPDVANIKDLVIHVQDAQQMIHHLRSMPHDRLIDKQQALIAVQPKFAYLEHAGPRTLNAADLLVKGMCERWQHQQKNPPKLVDPLNILASHSHLYRNGSAPVEKDAQPATGSSVLGSAGVDAELVGADKHHVAVRRGDVVDQNSGHRKRRSRPSKRLERTKVTVAEALKSDGKWAVSAAEQEEELANIGLTDNDPESERA